MIEDPPPPRRRGAAVRRVRQPPPPPVDRPLPPLQRNPRRGRRAARGTAPGAVPHRHRALRRQRDDHLGRRAGPRPLPAPDPRHRRHPGLRLALHRSRVRNLRHAHWHSWPEVEHAAIQDFLLGKWQHTISQEEPPQPVDDVLCAIAQAEDDLAAYLEVWHESPHPVAARHLVRFVLWSWRPMDQQLTNPFWLRARPDPRLRPGGRPPPPRRGSAMPLSTSRHPTPNREVRSLRRPAWYKADKTVWSFINGRASNASHLPSGERTRLAITA